MTSTVFNKTEQDLKAVNEFAALLRDKAARLGYGAQANPLIDEAVAQFGRHESYEAAAQYATDFARAIFQNGTLNLTEANVAEKVREVFAAGWDAAKNEYEVGE